MKPYGVKRQDAGCCPGHDKYPQDRYNTTRTDQRKRAQKPRAARERQLNHQLRLEHIGNDTAYQKLLNSEMGGSRPPIDWQIYSDQERAERIREIKRGTTFRGLSKFYYPEEHSGHEDQYAGIFLCRWALKVLYPEHDILWMYKPEEKFGQKFIDDNASFLYDPKQDRGYIPYWWM